MKSTLFLLAGKRFTVRGSARSLSPGGKSPIRIVCRPCSILQLLIPRFCRADLGQILFVLPWQLLGKSPANLSGISSVNVAREFFSLVSEGFQAPPQNSLLQFTPRIVGIPPTPRFFWKKNKKRLFMPIDCLRGSAQGSQTSNVQGAWKVYGIEKVFLILESQVDPWPDTSEKYRGTPPISIAIRLQKYAVLLAESSVYSTTLYITIRRPSVSKCLCRNIRVRRPWNTSILSYQQNCQFISLPTDMTLFRETYSIVFIKNASRQALALFNSLRRGVWQISRSVILFGSQQKGPAEQVAPRVSSLKTCRFWVCVFPLIPWGEYDSQRPLFGGGFLGQILAAPSLPGAFVYSRFVRAVRNFLLVFKRSTTLANKWKRSPKTSHYARFWAHNTTKTVARHVLESVTNLFLRIICRLSQRLWRTMLGQALLQNIDT